MSTTMGSVATGFDSVYTTVGVGANTIASTSYQKPHSVTEVLELVHDNLVVRSVDINELSLLDAADSKNEIKKKIAEQLTVDVLNKTTFTRQENYLNCSATVRGRVYIFSETELKNLINQLTR